MRDQSPSSSTRRMNRSGIHRPGDMGGSRGDRLLEGFTVMCVKGGWGLKGGYIRS